MKKYQSPEINIKSLSFDETVADSSNGVELPYEMFDDDDPNA